MNRIRDLVRDLGVVVRYRVKERSPYGDVVCGEVGTRLDYVLCSE